MSLTKDEIEMVRAELKDDPTVAPHWIDRLCDMALRSITAESAMGTKTVIETCIASLTAEAANHGCMWSSVDTAYLYQAIKNLRQWGTDHTLPYPMRDENECQACVDGKCTAKPGCVTCSNTP